MHVFNSFSLTDSWLSNCSSITVLKTKVRCGCSQPGAIVERMGVVRAKIQTVEDIYRLVRMAVESKRPIRAVYRGHERRLCPHRLGRNHEGQMRVLCYQYAGDSRSGLQAAGSPANWRCIAIEKLSKVELIDEAWHTAPNHSRPQTCFAEVDIDTED